MEGGGEGRSDAVWLGGDVIIVEEMLTGGTAEGSEVEAGAECVG